MKTLEELKKHWDSAEATIAVPSQHDQSSLQKIFASRAKKHIGTVFTYFWGSLVLQIMVYSILAHVIIRYGSDRGIFALGLLEAILYLPFTIVLMSKFKGAAKTIPAGDSGASLYQHLLSQHSKLQAFYKFKIRYELALIPLSAVVGVFLTFRIYVPGGVMAFPTAAAFVFGATLVSCIVAIYLENKKSFRTPLDQLQVMLDEFKHEVKENTSPLREG